MKFVIVSLLSLFSLTFLKAQDTTSYKPLTKFPILNLSSTNYGKSDFKNNAKGNLKFHEFRGSLQMAFPIKKKKRYVLQRFDFTSLNIESSIESDSVKTAGDFYSYAYSIGLIEVLKRNWKLIGILTPTLASDFENKLSHEDFILQAAATATKRVNKYWEYGFGLSYNTRFGRPILIPIAIVNYKKEHWSLNTVLPAYVAGFYQMKNSKIGMSLSVFGNNYNNRDASLVPVDLDKIVYSRLTFGPQYELKLYKALYLNLYTGVFFNNKIQSITKAGHIDLDLSTKPNIFGRIGINIQL